MFQASLGYVTVCLTQKHQCLLLIMETQVNNRLVCLVRLPVSRFLCRKSEVFARHCSGEQKDGAPALTASYQTVSSTVGCFLFRFIV